MPAGLLLEYLDAAGVALGDIGTDRNGGGMETSYRPHIGHRNLARGCRDHRGDAFGAALGGGAAAEYGLARTPWRQAIDLRAHDAVEEIRCPRREFKGTKQETR